MRNNFQVYHDENEKMLNFNFCILNWQKNKRRDEV